MNDVNKIIKIKPKYSDRIDKYLSNNLDFSRNYVKKLIQNNAIFINKINIKKLNFKVKKDDEIHIMDLIKEDCEIIPENIKIDVIYEDEHIIVINKKSGMVVHPAPGHNSGTLVNALLYRFKKLSNINDKRPGIIHRIDKDTSGILIIAKNNKVHAILAERLKKHEIKRKYICWVKGNLKNQITHINLPIGRDPKNRKKMTVIKENSKEAITHVYVKKILSDRTLVKCELETGRTHQIRVHLSYIKHPIIGDPLYSNNKDTFGQQLHAYSLEFIHPITQKKMIFHAKPPKEFLQI